MLSVFPYSNRKQHVRGKTNIVYQNHAFYTAQAKSNMNIKFTNFEYKNKFVFLLFVHKMNKILLSLLKYTVY